MLLTDDMSTRIATFRFGIIGDFVTGSKLEHGEKMKLVREKSLRQWDIPGSSKSSISSSTILSWIKRYENAGRRLDGLKPKTRSDRGKYRKLDATLQMAIRELKQKNPKYTVPVIINKLKHAKILGPEDRVNSASIYRFIRKEDLSKPTTEAIDRRRFEAAHPNEIWQCDIMHGPKVRVDGVLKKKSYLCAIMDDHSRLIVHAEFYGNETFDTLKSCLKDAVSRRGIPQRFYVDNGACYRAVHLSQILASLGSVLTHSRPYTPQGRGKIERWFRYVRQDFIPTYVNEPLSLEQLNEYLDEWVDRYNSSIHGSTHMTPYEKFKKNLACVRSAPDNLIDHFRKVETRKVKKDRTVHLHSRIFEVPAGLIDRQVDLYYHPDDPERVEVYTGEKSQGIATLVDVHVNARTPRESYMPSEKQSEFLMNNESIKSGELFGRLEGERDDESL